jgi:hypothetical protein
MKLILCLIALSFSLSASAFVESKNCPSKIGVTLFDITRAQSREEIQNNWSVKSAWESFSNQDKLDQKFSIVSRTDSALCVYSNGHQALFLETNNGVDELVIPVNEKLYMRTKILSFGKDFIEPAIDEESKQVVAPIIQLDSDGGSMTVGEVSVGEVEAIDIDVL